jgi:hypothetical protein
MTHGDNKGVARHNAATRKLYEPMHYPENWRFRGVDGEGGNVQEPGTLFGTRHQYLSLRCGPDLLETGQPLDWRECFTFLADQPSRGYIYVAYFFDYDVTMMIRTLPKRIAKQLLSRDTRAYQRGGENGINCVRYEGFDFDYLPHKEFKVRRTGTQRYVVINDVGQFFQQSFLTALDKWDIGTEEERQIIEYGKAQRASFAGVAEEIRVYNMLECDLLEQLMDKFRSVCQETGYVPSKWQGPGYLASAMLKKHGIPRRDTIGILKNHTFYDLALAAYYGGRFETTCTGPFRHPVYQYDINSAYPSELRNLPCLTHGEWVQSDTRPKAGLWFGRVQFTHPVAEHPRLCNLPFRNRLGHILYPMEGTGVYWSPELEAAEAAGTRIQFERGWIYESHCDCQWFNFIDDYYQKRLRLGKSAKGYVLKLAGNSIYGKLAQSIGYAPWANPVWAGLITAGCRARLINAYSQNPEQCLMLATDGLFMGAPIDLPISNKLGEWDYTEHPDGIFFVQPGIYFTGEDVKTRGVEKGRIYGMRDDFERAWEHWFWDDKNVDVAVKVPVVNFVTARQAVQWGKWDMAGIWQDDLREIHFDWINKRAESLITSYVGEDHIRTWPKRFLPDKESVPYNRTIGGNEIVADQDRYTDEGLKEKVRYEEQPDWVAPLY